MPAALFASSVSSASPLLVALPLVRHAAGHYYLSVPQVLGKRQVPAYCHARWAVWLALHKTGVTPQRIGQAFGRHRDTVKHGLKAARRLLATNDLFRDAACACVVLLSDQQPITNNL